MFDWKVKMATAYGVVQAVEWLDTDYDLLGNEAILYAHMSYATILMAQIGLLLLVQFSLQKSKPKEGETPTTIWVPNLDDEPVFDFWTKPVDRFAKLKQGEIMHEEVVYTTSTYHEHETKLFHQSIQLAFMGAVLTYVVIKASDFKSAIYVQVVFALLNIVTEEQLIQKHVYKTVKAEARVWGEKMHGELTAKNSFIKEKYAIVGPNISENPGGHLEFLIWSTLHAGRGANYDDLIRPRCLSADVNFQTTIDGFTLLMVCTVSRLEASHETAIPRLMQRGADIALQDKEGWTVFHWCVWHQAADALQVIVEASTPDKVKAVLQLESNGCQIVDEKPTPIDGLPNETPLAMGERLAKEGDIREDFLERAHKILDV